MLLLRAPESLRRLLRLPPAAIVVAAALNGCSGDDPGTQRVEVDVEGRRLELVSDLDESGRGLACFRLSGGDGKFTAERPQCFLVPRFGVASGGIVAGPDMSLGFVASDRRVAGELPDQLLLSNGSSAIALRLLPLDAATVDACVEVGSGLARIAGVQADHPFILVRDEFGDVPEDGLVASPDVCPNGPTVAGPT